MNFAEAGKIERPPIVVGQSYTFYSTVQEGRTPPDERLRNYTGKLVKVVSWENEDECREEAVARQAWLAEGNAVDDFDETEPMYIVKAADGREFSAYQGELNGWYCDTGQFFWSDGTHGPDRDPRFLVNESKP